MMDCKPVLNLIEYELSIGPKVYAVFKNGIPTTKNMFYNLHDAMAEFDMQRRALYYEPVTVLNAKIIKTFEKI